MQKKHGRSLHDQVVREIGQQIVWGKWPVGTPLPHDTVLCARLHISRTALREALITLASKGLLEARQKIGTIVRPREEWNMLDGDVLRWRVESNEGDAVVAELYGLRRLIEPLAASLAAVHATRTDIERLTKAYDDMVAAGDDGEQVLEPDVRFHRAIIAASGNALFASVGLVVASALEANFAAIKDSPRGHTWALPLHKAILEAIAAHHGNRARVAMQKLLDASQKDLQAARAGNGGIGRSRRAQASGRPS